MSPARRSAKDQVARLLTLVPYLHAHGEVRVDDAAKALGVDPDQLFRRPQGAVHVRPAGRLPRRPDRRRHRRARGAGRRTTDGVIRVSNADYLARPLRLNPTEASAVIVALRALRNGAKDDTREVVDRALAKLEAAAAQGSTQGSAAAQIDPGDDAADTDLALLASRLQTAADRGRQVRLSLLRPEPRRAVRAGRRPARRRDRRRPPLPRRLVPQRRGAAAVPAGPDRPGRGARRARSRRPRRGRATSATASSASPRTSPR